MNGVALSESDVFCSSIRELQAQIGTQIDTLARSSAKDSALLNADIGRQLTDLRSKHRELDGFADELDSLEEQELLKDEISAFGKQYEGLQRRLRHANQQVRHGAEKAAFAERRALLAGANPVHGQRKLQTEEEAVDAAEDVTSSLQRTRQLLAQELEHTGTALEAMETSHSTLGATTKQYGAQGASLAQSHRLLGTMRWHNILDWLMLWGGIAFFALVVLYILQKRLIYFVPSALIPKWGGSSPLPQPPATLDATALDMATHPPGNMQQQQQQQQQEQQHHQQAWDEFYDPYPNPRLDDDPPGTKESDAAPVGQPEPHTPAATPPVSQVSDAATQTQALTPSASGQVGMGAHPHSGFGMQSMGAALHRLVAPASPPSPNNQSEPSPSTEEAPPGANASSNQSEAAAGADGPAEAPDATPVVQEPDEAQAGPTSQAPPSEEAVVNTSAPAAVSSTAKEAPPGTGAPEPPVSPVDLPEGTTSNALHGSLPAEVLANTSELLEAGGTGTSSADAHGPAPTVPAQQGSGSAPDSASTAPGVASEPAAGQESPADVSSEDEPPADAASEDDPPATQRPPPAVQAPTPQGMPDADDGTAAQDLKVEPEGRASPSVPVDDSSNDPAAGDDTTDTAPDEDSREHEPEVERASAAHITGKEAVTSRPHPGDEGAGSEEGGEAELLQRWRGWAQEGPRDLTPEEKHMPESMQGRNPRLLTSYADSEHQAGARFLGAQDEDEGVEGIVHEEL